MLAAVERGPKIDPEMSIIIITIIIIYVLSCIHVDWAGLLGSNQVNIISLRF